MNSNVRVYALLGLVSLIYGTNYVVAKAAMTSYLQPFGFIVLRVFVATILFWIYHALTVAEPVKHRRDYLKLALCGFLGVCCNQLAFFKGLSMTSAVNASLIMTITPIITVVASAIILKEKLRSVQGLGILLGSIGAFLLIFNENAAVSADSLGGDLLVLFNASSYGTYLVVVRPLMARYNAATVVKWVFFFGFFMVLPFGLGEALATDYASFPWQAWGAIGFVIIGTTFIAYLLNARALKHVSSAIVGYFIYLQPVFATLISVGLGYETFTWLKGFFSLMIFAGVFLVIRSRK
ncbi:DMT family transporter [Roseivirga sp. BDSF3-8]|uniref:DMT family transporter n=1 Tax=Roseivirga sp. BDSF3-8 TaxID=3241598 RepID=UPI003531B2F3